MKKSIPFCTRTSKSMNILFSTIVACKQCLIGAYFSPDSDNFFHWKESILWIEDWCFSPTQGFEVKNVLVKSLIISNTLRLASRDVNWWTGLVWIIMMFLSAVWTLILTAPIHCRGSIGEQVMECKISLNLFRWRNINIMPWGWTNFHFWVNYSFNYSLMFLTDHQCWFGACGEQSKWNRQIRQRHTNHSGSTDWRVSEKRMHVLKSVTCRIEGKLLKMLFRTVNMLVHFVDGLGVKHL